MCGLLGWGNNRGAEFSRILFCFAFFFCFVFVFFLFFARGKGSLRVAATCVDEVVSCKTLALSFYISHQNEQCADTEEKKSDLRFFHGLSTIVDNPCFLAHIKKLLKAQTHTPLAVLTVPLCCTRSRIHVHLWPHPVHHHLRPVRSCSRTSSAVLRVPPLQQGTQTRGTRRRTAGTLRALWARAAVWAPVCAPAAAAVRSLRGCVHATLPVHAHLPAGTTTQGSTATVVLPGGGDGGGGGGGGRSVPHAPRGVRVLRGEPGVPAGGDDGGGGVPAARVSYGTPTALHVPGTGAHLAKVRGGGSGWTGGGSDGCDGCGGYGGNGGSGGGGRGCGGCGGDGCGGCGLVPRSCSHGVQMSVQELPCLILFVNFDKICGQIHNSWKITYLEPFAALPPFAPPFGYDCKYGVFCCISKKC